MKNLKQKCVAFAGRVQRLIMFFGCKIGLHKEWFYFDNGKHSAIRQAPRKYASVIFFSDIRRICYTCGRVTSSTEREALGKDEYLPKT